MVKCPGMVKARFLETLSDRNLNMTWPVRSLVSILAGFGVWLTLPRLYMRIAQHLPVIDRKVLNVIDGKPKVTFEFVWWFNWLRVLIPLAALAVTLFIYHRLTMRYLADKGMLADGGAPAPSTPPEETPQPEEARASEGTGQSESSSEA